MSATDALTITSALDALTRYYDAKEREENAVLYINDAYLEALNSLEKLEAENVKLRELVRDVYTLHWNGLDCTECPWFDECDTTGGCPWLSIFADHMRELGVEAD